MKYFLFWLNFYWIHVANSGYTYEGGLGSDCLYDEDCLTRNAFCKGNKICTCKIGYQYDAGNDICFPREVNLRCSEDYDCSALQNAKCLNGICQCKNNYIAARDKSSCLPSMKLTSICEEDIQCNSVMNRSFCDPILRRCVCQRGLRHDSYRMQCLERLTLHATCLNDEDCEWPEENRGRVECRNTRYTMSTCECREGFIEDHDICYNGCSNIIVSSIVSLASVMATFIY